MKALSSLYRWIVKAEEFCSKLLLVAIIILCFISALARYMNFTVTWSLDLVLLLFSWFAGLLPEYQKKGKSWGRHIDAPFQQKTSMRHRAF